MKEIPDGFDTAVRRLLRRPAGLCVALGIFSALGGPEHGTQASLVRHGLKPTGSTRGDIVAHLRYHQMAVHAAEVESVGTRP